MYSKHVLLYLFMAGFREQARLRSVSQSSPKMRSRINIVRSHFQNKAFVNL
nr:hypothetical protein [Dendronalium sp. ChiSLP03b]